MRAPYPSRGRVCRYYRLAAARSAADVRSICPGTVLPRVPGFGGCEVATIASDLWGVYRNANDNSTIFVSINAVVVVPNGATSVAP